MPQPVRLDAHIARTRTERAVQLLLDRKRFRRSDARNALVEVADYFGVNFAHPSVEAGELAVKVNRNERDYGHYYQNAQREQRVEYEHRHNRDQRIYRVEHPFVDVPGEYRRNIRRIAHYPRVDFSHAGYVEISYRKGLQMVESRAAHIP